MFIRSACLKTYPLHRSLLLRNSKESQNLCLPAGFSKHPVLVCEFNDCSLYILCAEKECTAWKIHLQEEVGDDGGDDNGAMMRMMMMICCHLTSLSFQAAFNNNNVLREQQVTHDDIPVIVDKCVKFVYRLDILSNFK